MRDYERGIAFRHRGVCEGRSLVTDVGFVLDPSASTATACTAGGGGSTFNVRNFNPTDKAWLVDMWRNGATAGFTRIRSSKFADNVQGIRVQSGAELSPFLLDREYPQQLYPSDTLTVEMTGGTTETDTVAYQSYYDNLPGNDPVLKMPGDILSAYEYFDTWQVNTTASGTIGSYGSTLVNSLYSVLAINLWVAVLGYVTDTELTAIGLTGPDLAQLNIAGPGSTTPAFTRRYFVDLSNNLGKPCIPLFSTGNVGATNVITADDAASTTAKVSLIIAVMPTGWTP